VHNLLCLFFVVKLQQLLLNPVQLIALRSIAPSTSATATGAASAAVRPHSCSDHSCSVSAEPDKAGNVLQEGGGRPIVSAPAGAASAAAAEVTPLRADTELAAGQAAAAAFSVLQTGILILLARCFELWRLVELAH
jgi:hypothetical protein